MKKYLADGKGVVFFEYANDPKKIASQLGASNVIEIGADDPLFSGLHVPRRHEAPSGYGPARSAE